MSNGKFDDEGDNPVDNPNIFNVEGDDRLLPGLQPLTTFGSAIVYYYIPKIILLSFTKQSFKVFKHLIVVLEETTFDVMIVEFFNDYLNLGATSPCLIIIFIRYIR